MKNVMSRMINKERKGFSLVELVVVILIIAILAAAIFLGGATVIRQSRESAVRNDLRNLGTYVQDAMYANPKLQYHQDYSKGEFWTYDATTKTLTRTDEEAKREGTDADFVADNMRVVNLLNKEYLTADFQLGIENTDPWNNPYCFSFEQIPSAETGKSSSCIVVINSLGTNSRDETSDGQGVDAQKIAKLFKTDMTNATATASNPYKSAQGFVESSAFTTAYGNSDDYGVVICMIDGQVSTAYYGF